MIKSFEEDYDKESQLALSRRKKYRLPVLYESVEDDLYYVADVLYNDYDSNLWNFEQYGMSMNAYVDDNYGDDGDYHTYHQKQLPQQRFSLDDIVSFPSIKETFQCDDRPQNINVSYDSSVESFELIHVDEQQQHILEDWELMSDIDSVKTLNSECSTTVHLNMPVTKTASSYNQAVLTSPGAEISANDTHLSDKKSCIFKRKIVRVTKNKGQRISNASSNDEHLIHGECPACDYGHAIQCQKETRGGRDSRKFKGNEKSDKYSRHHWISWDKEGQIESRRQYNQSVRKMCIRAVAHKKLHTNSIWGWGLERPYTLPN